MSPSMIGLSWLGVEVTASLPSLPTISQAHPEPKRPRPALPSASLKAANPPSSDVIAWASAPVGSPPPPGFMICQNSEWLACPPPLFRTAVRIASGTASRCAIRSSIVLPWSCGMVLERVVEVRDVGLVVLRVMDLHRLGVDVRLERPVVIRQGRQGVFGHGVVLTSWSCFEKFPAAQHGRPDAHVRPPNSELGNRSRPTSYHNADRGFQKVPDGSS